MKKFLLMFTMVGLVIFGCNYSCARGGITYDDNLTTWTDLNGNSFEYGTITIEHDGDSITMMDRNLGATTNNINNRRSYGYHYQWGNNYGFDPFDVSVEDNAISERVDASGYGPGNYFFNGVFRKIMRDWSSSRNDNLRGGGRDSQENNRGLDSNTEITDRQGPCPEGYHVPSLGEWSKTLEYWVEENKDLIPDERLVYHENGTFSLANNVYICYDENGHKTECVPEGNVDMEYLNYDNEFLLKIQQDLKIPFAGLRGSDSAQIGVMGIDAHLWSSSPASLGFDSARSFDLHTGGAGTTVSAGRAFAFSVRCFKNPDNENTSSSQGNNNNIDFEYDTLRFNPYYSDEMNMAYQYAYHYGITTISNIRDANMNGGLNRIAMAKMLSYFAENVLGMDDFDTRRNCEFNDVPTYLDRQYNYGVTKACQLGIMGVNMPDNKFYPNGGVTRAEFATALSRLLYGTRDGTDVYYSTHISKLYREGIISNTNPNLQEKRGYVMLMLMRSQDDGSTSNNNNSSTTYHSPNMIDITPFLHLSNVDTTCNWTDRTINERYGNYYIYVPNSTWAADARFVNNALQDIRNNGEYLVQNYITQANNVLDSNSLTNRDGCKYSFLIYALENQKGELTSYKTENGITTIGVDFYSYKETLDEYDRDPAGGTFIIYKNTSTKSRNYRLAENPQLEILKVDSNGHTNAVYYFDAPDTRSYISNWNTWINTYCNNEIVYNGKSPDLDSNISNYNWNTNNALCIKNRLSNPGDRSLTFTFDNLGNISKIGGFYYWLDFHS